MPTNNRDRTAAEQNRLLTEEYQRVWEEVFKRMHTPKKRKPSPYEEWENKYCKKPEDKV